MFPMILSREDYGTGTLQSLHFLNPCSEGIHILLCNLKQKIFRRYGRRAKYRPAGNRKSQTPLLPYHIHPSSTPKEQECPLGCAGVTIAEVGGEGLLHQAGWRSCHFEFWGCSHAAGILGLIPVLHVFLPLAHANMQCSELGVEVPHSWLSQRDAWPFVLPQLRYRRS